MVIPIKHIIFTAEIRYLENTGKSICPKNSFLKKISTFFDLFGVLSFFFRRIPKFKKGRHIEIDITVFDDIFIYWKFYFYVLIYF